MSSPSNIQKRSLSTSFKKKYIQVKEQLSDKEVAFIDNLLMVSPCHSDSALFDIKSNLLVLRGIRANSGKAQSNSLYYSPASINDVAKALKISRTTTQRYFKSLEKKGVLQKIVYTRDRLFWMLNPSICYFYVSVNYYYISWLWKEKSHTKACNIVDNLLRTDKYINPLTLETKTLEYCQVLGFHEFYDPEVSYLKHKIKDTKVSSYRSYSKEPKQEINFNSNYKFLDDVKLNLNYKRQSNENKIFY